MSSDSKPQVETLEFEGRGHKKGKPIIRRIRQEHGTLILSLPRRLGAKLNQEVVIVKEGSNPLSWLITIKPISQEKKT